VWRCGGPESGDCGAGARARAVPGDKPLKTCDNDEKETLCGLLLAYEVGIILRRA
jgi:hypothetical protein